MIASVCLIGFLDHMGVEGISATKQNWISLALDKITVPYEQYYTIRLITQEIF